MAGRVFLSEEGSIPGYEWFRARKRPLDVETVIGDFQAMKVLLDNTFDRVVYRTENSEKSECGSVITTWVQKVVQTSER